MDLVTAATMTAIGLDLTNADDALLTEWIITTIDPTKQKMLACFHDLDAARDATNGEYLRGQLELCGDVLGLNMHDMDEATVIRVLDKLGAYYRDQRTSETFSLFAYVRGAS